MAGGRPSKYQDDTLEQAYKLTLLGATDEQLADFFDVSTTTIDNWKKNKPEFLGALKEGKKKADATVADSLYNRAIGYEFIEEQAFKIKKSQYEEEVEVVEVRRVVPPDPTSCFFWLKNRNQENWRDKSEVKHNVNMTFEGILSDLDGRSSGLPED